MDENLEHPLPQSTILNMCLQCGAIIADSETHRLWHERLLMMAQQAAKDAYQELRRKEDNRGKFVWPAEYAEPGNKPKNVDRILDAWHESIRP